MINVEMHDMIYGDSVIYILMLIYIWNMLW